MHNDDDIRRNPRDLPEKELDSMKNWISSFSSLFLFTYAYLTLNEMWVCWFGLIYLPAQDLHICSCNFNIVYCVDCPVTRCSSVLFQCLINYTLYANCKPALCDSLFILCVFQVHRYNHVTIILI